MIMGMIILTACSLKENTELTSSLDAEENIGIDDSFRINEITYSRIKADWHIYQDAQELVEASVLVVLGKVTGISFQVLDQRTALLPTEKTEEWNRSLYTMYDIDIITMYKGSPIKSTQVRMIGGLKDSYLEEQVAVLGKDIEKGIPLMEDMPEIKIGETYLFALYQYEDTAPTLLNLEQSVFDLHELDKKDRFSFISVKDVISYFGKDKWEEFQQSNETAP